MNWVVIVWNEGTWEETSRQVVIGPFREEVTADGWAERVRQGYRGLGATVEWAYSPRPKDALAEGLADLAES